MVENDNDNPLSDLTVSTDKELIDELRDRFPRGFIFAAIKESRDGKHDIFDYAWNGGLATGLGLVQYVNSRLMDLAFSDRRQE